MRLLLLTEFLYDFSTFRLILESLARVYSSRGYRVETAGQSDPRVPFTASTLTAWGRVSRIGGSSLDPAVRAEKSRRTLAALVSGADVIHLHTAGSWTPLLSRIADACAICVNHI